MPKIKRSKKQPKIIVIVGPTASGKSALAIKLAEKYNGEIISADSRQVYRGMNIGTGKVTIKEQKTIRHYLLDVSSPKKQFTAEDFKKLGEKAISDIQGRKKIPIIVGGTGFYIDILLRRAVTASVSSNKKLRAKLSRYALRKAQLAYRGSSIYHKNSKGIFDKSGRNLEAKFLFELLQGLDPEYSKTIDRHNKRRLIRALEIIITTGKPVPKIVTNSKYNLLWLGLNPKNLKDMIQKRLDTRLRQGMIKEVEKLHRQGVSWKRLDDFGLEYRWISRYIRRLVSKGEMKDKLYRDIVKYSKRQMTWFKRNKEIHWISPNLSQKEEDKLLKNFL